MTIDITPEAAPLDEEFDTMMDVSRDPHGAWQAIQFLSAALAASRKEKTMSDNPLAALAMRERAASEMDIAAHVMSHYGSDIEQRTYQYAGKQIRALPTTFTNAELLAAAMRLPEVRALVDAAEKALMHEGSAFYGPQSAQNSRASFKGVTRHIRAALAPFTKVAS